jgi:hypothetical protein
MKHRLALVVVDPTTKSLKTLTRHFEKKCRNMKFNSGFIGGTIRQNEMHITLEVFKMKMHLQVPFQNEQ